MQLGGLDGFKKLNALEQTVHQCNVQLNGGDGVKKQMQPAMRLQMSTIVLSRSVQFITRFRKTLLRVTFPAFHFLIFEVMRCFSDQLKFPDL